MNSDTSVIAEIQKAGEEFYAWADAEFYDHEECRWPDNHPWGTCTFINDVARVLLAERGIKSSIIGLPDHMMPDWWREKYPTGHDWVRAEGGGDVDLWPLLYGEPGFRHPPLPVAAVVTYGDQEPGPVRLRAEADLRAWRTARNISQ